MDCLTVFYPKYTFASPPTERTLEKGAPLRWALGEQLTTPYHSDEMLEVLYGIQCSENWAPTYYEPEYVRRRHSPARLVTILRVHRPVWFVCVCISIPMNLKLLLMQ